MFKISVITPSYNQGAYLEETIQSVLSQSYPNFEYILIDGGSIDESVEIIKKYDNEFSYSISEKDNGQSEAINKGFKVATGEIITWINSDDLLMPGALEKIAKLFSTATEDIGVIYGGTTIFKNGRELGYEYTYGTPSVERFISGMGFPQPSAFIKKKYLDKVGMLREDLHYGMDYDLFARLSCVCHFEGTHDLFSKYRLHDESKSVASSHEFRKDWNNVFISLCKYLGWEEVLNQLFEYEPELKNERYFTGYHFEPDFEIVNSINREKVLFFFLSDLLLNKYWYDERKDARILLAKMRDFFKAEWFNEDVRVRKVVSKLNLPESILIALKAFKKVIHSFN